MFSWAPFAGAWVEVRSNIGGAEMNPRLEHTVGVEDPARGCVPPACTYFGLKWECTRILLRAPCPIQLFIIIMVVVVGV